MNLCSLPNKPHEPGCVLRYGGVGIGAVCRCAKIRRDAKPAPERQNPKHLQAQLEDKTPLEYLVYSVLEDDARCLKHGADKYGIRNWLKNPIQSSTYEGAMLRHLKAWLEGEDIDPDSGYSHLTHLRACCAVVLDAESHGTLIDDRNRVESKEN